MANLTIRKLDDPLKARLRVQAATHGHSMEAEARDILRAALNHEHPSSRNLADAIHDRFARHGGVNLEPPARDELVRDPPTFD